MDITKVFVGINDGILLTGLTSDFSISLQGIEKVQRRYVKFFHVVFFFLIS